MASGAFTVTVCLALLATLCHGVPDLVFKNNNGADDGAKFGDSLFTPTPTEFAENFLSVNLKDHIDSGMLDKFKYFGENDPNKVSFNNARVS